MLFLHSVRSIRKACNTCGLTEGLYWAHDVTKPKGEVCGSCLEKHSERIDGAMILVEKRADGTPFVHECHRSKYTAGDPLRPEMVSGKSASPAAPTPASMPAKVPTPAAVTAADTPKDTPKVIPTPNASTDDTALALAEMLARLANSGPQVDEDMVREMVKQQFASVVFPTRTVTLNAEDGERKEIPGATHFKLADVLMDLEAGEHVMLVGPAGTGKSTIAEQCATAMGLEFRQISLASTTTLSQIIGYNDANGNYNRTPFRDAFEHGMLFIFDEIDNGNPGILTVLNSALANGLMAFPDGMVKRHENFKVVATANTYGTGPDRKYVGRNALDAAFLDRFVMEEIPIDEALERAVCDATGASTDDVVRVLTYVRGLRKTAQRHRMSVILSPRATAGMCKLLRVGRKWDDAVAARVRRGMSDQDWGILTS